MTELYTESYAARQRKEYGKWLTVCIAVVALTLMVCITLCFFVSTGTARALFFTVAGLSTLSGWVYILILRPKRRSALAQYRHCDGMLKKGANESEFLTGEVRVLPYEVQVPGSIRVKPVKLINEQGERSLHMNARFSLPEGRLALRCAGNYVAAYEVAEDA